jgi:cytochrome c553
LQNQTEGKNMKITLSILSLFLLLGCSGEQNTKESTPTKKPLETKITKPVQQKQTTPKQEIVAPKQEMAAPVKVVQKDGATLYKKCLACHGIKAEKKALNKSQIIADWDAQKITDAIKGYQRGTYGGSMKGLMTGQVKDLNNEDIAVLAAYISKL